MKKIGKAFAWAIVRLILTSRIDKMFAINDTTEVLFSLFFIRSVDNTKWYYLQTQLLSWKNSYKTRTMLVGGADCKGQESRRWIEAKSRQALKSTKLDANQVIILLLLIN